MAFNTFADFNTGKYKIAQDNFSQATLTAYITKFEKRYLQDLMGIELYNLFVADLVANIPQTQRFEDIYNEFAEDDDGLVSGLSGMASSGNKIVRSEGIKEMLKGFIFFEYNRDLPVKNTMTGNVQEDNENSKVLTSLKAGITEKYNEAIATYKAIQWKLEDESATYPEYNGVCKEIIWI